MKIIITINDSKNAYSEYEYTGNLPQVRKRFIEMDIGEIKLKEGESIESVNLKLM